jgi:transposase
MLTFGGMQWRLAGLLSGIPFTTLHSAFARWTRLGLWRRLGQRLALDWRIACGDEALPSALVVDSRSQRSSPTCFARGIDGGKNIKGIKLHVVCDKHGSLIDLEVTPANHDDRASALPMLPRLAELGFQGDLLADNGKANPSPRQCVLTIWRFRSRLEEHPVHPQWRSLGGRAPVRLAFTLSQAQYSVRPQPRSLCLPRLDRHHLHPGAPPPPKPKR